MLRLLEGLTRFAAGIRLFGMVGAVRVFLWDKWRPSAALSGVPLPYGVFRYRPDRDRDLVIGHFCVPLYRLHAPSVRTIVDAGAHIGDETARFRVWHPEARILAIEADAVNVATLRANWPEGDPLVTVAHRALWPTVGTVQIADGDCPQGSHVAETGTTVETITPDDVLAWAGGAIDVFKMDIEGAEAALFAEPCRAATWLRCVGILVMECPDQDAPGTTSRVFDALRHTGLSWTCVIAGECLVWTHRPEVRVEREAYLFAHHQ